MNILQEAERLTTGPRQDSYDHPLDNWTRVAGAFNAIFAHKIKDPFTAEEMLLAMVLVKTAREAYKPKQDNRVDACGYLNCIEMSYAERERRAQLV